VASVSLIFEALADAMTDGIAAGSRGDCQPERSRRPGLAEIPAFEPGRGPKAADWSRQH
jgi:hypothetical protein